MLWQQISSKSYSKESTPLKFNMEPENEPLEEANSFWKPSFSGSGSMLVFGGVIFMHEWLPDYPFPQKNNANIPRGFDQINHGIGRNAKGHRPTTWLGGREVIGYTFSLKIYITTNSEDLFLAVFFSDWLACFFRSVNWVYPHPFEKLWNVKAWMSKLTKTKTTCIHKLWERNINHSTKDNILGINHHQRRTCFLEKNAWQHPPQSTTERHRHCTAPSEGFEVGRPGGIYPPCHRAAPWMQCLIPHQFG